MKKTYIKPETIIQNIELHSALMDVSYTNKEIDSANAGLVKGTSSSTSRYNVWDDDWSE